MLKRVLILLAIATQVGVASATPEVGWWWNPNESGRGFFVENQNGITYVAGYLYAADGRATWMVAGGPNADPYNYTGRLLSFANGQSMFGQYRLPDPATDMGEITLHFSDDTHGTITWPGGTIPIVRQLFGAGTPSFDVDSGWWWNPEESGRGFSIERQGDTLVVASFMYDEDGNAVWYLSAGPMSSPTTYSGSWLQFANGQTMTGPYQTPTGPVIAGKLDIEFTASNEATMTFEAPEAAPAAIRGVPTKAGKIVTVPVKRQFPSKGRDPAKSYVGGFTVNTRQEITDPYGLAVVNVTYRSTDLVWRRDDGDLTPIYIAPPNGPWTVYRPVGGSITVEYSDSSIGNFGGGASVDCVTQPTQFSFPVSDTDGFLLVNNHGQFAQGYIRKELEFSTIKDCTATDAKGNQVRQSIPVDHVEFGLSLEPIQGTIQGTPERAITGSIPEYEWYPGLPFTPVSSAQYYFGASAN